MICIEDENRNQIEELERLMKEKLGIKFPFYMLHVYAYGAGVLDDERSWFIGTYELNDEEYYGYDKIDLDVRSIRDNIEVISRFKKFKQYARAKKFADEKNDWNGLYELKIEKIEKVEDMLI